MLNVNLVGLKLVSTANSATINTPPMGHRKTCKHHMIKGCCRCTRALTPQQTVDAPLYDLEMAKHYSPRSSDSDSSSAPPHIVLQK